jgi:hypothetical protein
MDVTEVTTGVLGFTERLLDRNSIPIILTLRLKAPVNTSPPKERSVLLSETPLSELEYSEVLPTPK